MMAAYGGRDFYYELSKSQDEEEEEEPNFLEQPPGRYYCLICHSVMRDPHIVMCCCKKMCGACIERVQHSGQPCPNCRKPDFVMYPERDLNSEILDLKVRCTHHTNGCEWVGELRDLKKHTDPEKGGCGFVQVKCPYGCPMAYLRHESDNHESVCTNLPPELQMRTMRATNQFKEELQVTLDQFQELYKSESKRVRELTDQLETMKENRKKEEQEMKHQFEAEKKQLLDECRSDYQQQIKLLTESLREEFTQEMSKMKKKSEEENQQQMVSLKQCFEKEEKERLEAAKRQLAELKEYYQKELKKNENESKQQRETPQYTETSIEESKVFTGLSKDVLLLMPKVNEGHFKMLQFFPEEGKVVVLAASAEEQEKCIQQFQETYQDIIKYRQLKSGDLEVPLSFPVEETFGLLDEFNDKYNQCHFSCDEKAGVIRIVSMSSRQFDQAKKLISDRLVGKKEKKEAKGGGEGGKGATGKLSTKMGSSEVYEISKGRTLMVKRGDIVSEDATILVNAANTRLDHAAGLAGALNKASGGELQRLSHDYIRSYGKVSVGGAALTKAGGGKLKCKWVIHAVGPIAHEQKSETMCSELIFTAISNSLIEAQKKNAASIVFPALSTGIYSVKNSQAANAIFQAILKFYYTSKNVLKDIRIVILDEETYTVFAQHLLSLKATGSDDASVQSHGATFNKSNSLPDGYDTSSSQGHTQPFPYSNVAAAGRGSALPFSGPALGTGAFGRGTSTTSTSATAPPPVVVIVQPTGQTHSQPHNVLSTNNAYTTTSSTDGILKPATFNYGVVGGGSSGGGGGAGGNEMGRGRGQWHGQQQSALNGAVTAQLLTPAEVTDLMLKELSRSSSHDESYSTPPTGSPSSITPPTNEEGATPGDDKGIAW